MQIIKTPLMTEKTTRLMEFENILVFEVDKKASKDAIKQEIESFFKAKVRDVRTRIGSDSRKRAFVKFSNDTPAIDIATKLGLM